MSEQHEHEINIIKPQEGFQEHFTRSNIDVVFGGGVLNCGKSFAAILAVAEPSLDPNFRACFTRRTFTELKGGGSLTDDFKVAYGSLIDIKSTDPPRVKFPSGAFVDFRQINDENIRKVTETWKGAQYDFIYMDELTSYEFSTFKYLLSRNRGKGQWTGKFRGTTNPEKDSWVYTAGSAGVIYQKAVAEHWGGRAAGVSCCTSQITACLRARRDPRGDPGLLAVS